MFQDPDLVVVSIMLYQRLEDITLPTSNSYLFSSYQRSNTYRTVKKLRIVLGTKVWRKMVRAVDDYHRELPEVEFVVLPLTSRMRDASCVACQQLLQDMCRKLAHVRAGDSKVTRKDDSEAANTIQIRKGSAEWLRENPRLR